jgi:hypothetical protein
LKFFKNQLYKISKIPLSRFDQEAGETWCGSDPTSVARTEIDFARFVTRLRNQFSQIILKPLQLQIALSIPEIQENRQLLEAISLQYKSYNLFEEMMEQDLAQKRVEFIQSMKDSMVDMNDEGSEIKFFSSKFLVQKYLKLSDADLALNDKLKKIEQEEWNLSGGDNSGEDDNMGFESQADKIANLVLEKLSNKLNLDTIYEVNDDEKIKDKPKKKKSKKTQNKKEEE